MLPTGLAAGTPGPTCRPQLGVRGSFTPRVQSAPWRSLSTRHGFGFVGICLLLAAGKGAGAGVRVGPCLRGSSQRGGKPRGTRRALGRVGFGERLQGGESGSCSAGCLPR